MIPKSFSDGFCRDTTHNGISDRVFDRILSERNIDAFNGAQGRILFVLWQGDGLSIKELSMKTGLATTTLTSMLDRMEFLELLNQNGGRELTVFQIPPEKGDKLMRTIDKLPVCAAATMIELIGSKWKLLIIRNLLDGTWRFGELRKDILGISPKVLTDNLRSLEADGLIIRTVYPEVPPKVEYSLSELGHTMKPLFELMEAWGNSYKEYILKAENTI